MPLFDWSEKFSVNIQEIDEQHKKLVGLLNFFHDEKLANKGQEAIGKVLGELLGYTATHFKKEEELLEQYNYPEYEIHKAGHASLILKVEIMQKKYSMGDNNITTDIAILLNDWLAEHILVEDKKYALHLNSKGIK